MRTPWEDAAAVFGPQKGADAATVARLAERLDRLADDAPRDPRGVPMTGCAGGLSGGLYAFRDARLVPGAAYVLDALGFDARAARRPPVITGEGRLDEQTLAGKAVGEVAARCRDAGVPATRSSAWRARPDGVAALGLAGAREATTLAELARAGRELAGGYGLAPRSARAGSRRRAG